MPEVEFGPDVDLDTESVVLPSGRVYTQAEADADAEYFEQRGRPSLGKGVSPQVSFRVPQTDKDELRELAVRLGRTEADIAREAFRRGLELVA